MPKYRSPIGKVVSCIRFLLIPTGVKSNKIKGNKEENQINSGINFSQNLGHTSKSKSCFCYFVFIREEVTISCLPVQMLKRSLINQNHLCMRTFYTNAYNFFTPETFYDPYFLILRILKLYAQTCPPIKQHNGLSISKTKIVSC